jgi:hypothetical protein
MKKVQFNYSAGHCFHNLLGPVSLAMIVKHAHSHTKRIKKSRKLHSQVTTSCTSGSGSGRITSDIQVNYGLSKSCRPNQTMFVYYCKANNFKLLHMVHVIFQKPTYKPMYKFNKTKRTAHQHRVKC